MPTSTDALAAATAAASAAIAAEPAITDRAAASGPSNPFPAFAVAPDPTFEPASAPIDLVTNPFSSCTLESPALMTPPDAAVAAALSVYELFLFSQRPHECR